MQTSETKCGFVSVIGIPNAGKSTLVNRMVGAKVSIVSRKVQTTRAQVLGIALHEKAQIVLIDTPGIFKPKKTLEKAMVNAALSSFDNADFVLHIVDAAQSGVLEKNDLILKALEGRKNVLLILNKVDRIEKSALFELAQGFNDQYPYQATFMVSALEGKGVQDIMAFLAKELPTQDWMFPEDEITTMPMRLLAAEITREKIFHNLHQEIPYSIFVETENWEEFDNGSVKISQLIHVERDSQKAVVLGKGGSMVKKIGEAARFELEKIMGSKVHLKLFVKVHENWSERVENFALFGLDTSR